MTPREIQKGLSDLRALVGPDAYISASVITDEDKPLYGSVYPNGITRGENFAVQATEWPELLDAMRAQWTKRRETYRAELIERMALAIIATSARLGRCTESAMRAQFADRDVIELSEVALEKANTMAANGPFTIERSANSNAPEAA